MFHHFVVIILLNPVAAFFGTKQLFSKVQKVLQSVRAALKHSKKSPDSGGEIVVNDVSPPTLVLYSTGSFFANSLNPPLV